MKSVNEFWKWMKEASLLLSTGYGTGVVIGASGPILLATIHNAGAVCLAALLLSVTAVMRLKPNPNGVPEDRMMSALCLGAMLSSVCVLIVLGLAVVTS